jgi:hypothetical protein
MKTNLTLKLITLWLLPCALCFSGFSQGTAFTYQGRLNDVTNPANGSYDLTFALFNAVSGPGQVGATVTNSATAISNGLFTVTLDFGTGVFTGTSLWLEIAVRTNGSANGFIRLAPRQPLTASPYAITAANVTGGVNGSTITDGTITAAKIATNQVVTSLNTLRDNVTIQAGTNVLINVRTNNGTNAIVISAGGGGSGGGGGNGWLLTGNSNTIPGQDFVGTTDYQPLELHVNGGLAFRLEPASPGPNVIGGNLNDVNGSGAATIGGGMNNTVAGNSSTIGGGADNMIGGSAADGTIGGGAGNSIGFFDINSTIAGGVSNTIGGTLFSGSSTIGGGYNNAIISANGSTIAGGVGNVNSGVYSSIAGGQANFNEGAYAAIGGDKNTNSSDRATICGGLGNLIQTNAHQAFIGGGGNNSIANDSGWAFIGGGYQNSLGTNAFSSSILGGQHNTIGAGASTATVAGGDSNVAGGKSSFAAGSNAQATNDFTFVWTDGVPFSSTASEQFLIHASAGVGINKNNPGSNTNNPGATLDVNGGISSSGTVSGQLMYAQFDITAGGVMHAFDFIKTSDRTLKTNFAAIDRGEILERVAGLAISTWNFKQDPSTRHIGPMAQDFKAAFEVGTDDKHIGTVDAEGVALAAIQGLNQKLEQALQQRDAEILELKRRNCSLEEKFVDLRDAVRALAEKENLGSSNPGTK